MAKSKISPESNKNVEPQLVEMKVPLYSYGCEKKVKKALKQLKGIYSVNVDYKLQKVTVWGICDRDHVLATIKNKRRESCFWINSEEFIIDQLHVQQPLHQSDEQYPIPSSSPSPSPSSSSAKSSTWSWIAWKKAKKSN